MNQELLKIDLTFNDNVRIGDSFKILMNNELGIEDDFEFYFVKKRIERFQIEVGSSLESTLANFNRSFIADYGSKFNIKNPISNKLEIISKNPGWKYTGQIIKPGIPIKIDPISIPYNPFKILKVQFLTSVIAPCSNVIVKVTTNQEISKFCTNGNCTQLSGTEFIFLQGRGLTVVLDVFNINNIKATQTIKTPSLIDSPTNPISISVINGVVGATVNVNVPFPDELEYSFSIDNLNWQGSTVFSGLLEGNYVLYIKDNYGCKKQISFEVLYNNFDKPCFFISKENSIRFIEPSFGYLNEENRSFCDSPAKINYGFIQQFLNTDIITTQFKSNYNNTNVNVIDQLSGNITFVPLNKISNNIGLKAKYNQVKKYKISTAQFGIYFEEGHILDYDNNNIIDTYNLNGSLPIWAKIGNVIEINTVYYLIESIGFDENINAEVVVLNGSMNSQNVELIEVKCVYNIHDYEVYEFSIDFNNFQNTSLKIEIINSDPNFGTHRWISEVIESSSILTDTLEIRYFNSSNTNVIYSSGIQHLLRLPYNTLKANDSDSNESHKTDTNTNLLNSDVYEITDFEFMPLPLELYRKLKIALSMDSVFINGVGYTKNSEFNKENLGSTNLYKLTASMIKNGFVFNSNIDNPEIIIDGVINVPGLIEISSDGYVKL